MGSPIKHYGKWRIRWSDENGKRRSLSFGSYKDAEFELRQREVEVEKIKRGLIAPASNQNINQLIEELKLGTREPTTATKTFGELCDYWLDKRASQKRSGREDRSVIGHHLRPAFGHLYLQELGPEQIDQFKIDRSHLDKQTVNNLLKILISMLNAAVDMKWLMDRPKIKKAKVSKYSTDYRYLRTKDEINKFLSAAAEESEYVFVLYATAIFTGMRLGELAGLRKSNVDFEKRFIMVQKSFEGPTKNEGIRFVPILDPLLPILQNWFLKVPNDLVFPNSVGNMHQPSARVFQETLHKVIARAGFPKLQHKGRERWYIRFHDLRHTFASHWMIKGGDIFRLQKILGHGSTEMTQRYAHLAPDAFASDYARLGRSDGLALSRTAKVLPISFGK